MTIQSSLDNDINGLRRAMQTNPDLAVLGRTSDASSEVFVNGRPGYWWVRQIQAGGGFGPPQQVRGCVIPMQTTPGTPVRLVLDEGEKAVSGPDFIGLVANGVNPTQAAVVDPNANNPSFVNQAFIATAFEQIVEGTLTVAIRGSVPLVAGVFVKVEGQQDFTGNIPTAGEHCVAVTAVLSDLSDFETQYSTPKSTLIPLDLDDLNEAWALMSDPLTNKPLWSWDIGDDQTELVEVNRWMDNRQFLNWETPVSGGANYQTVQGNGTPATQEPILDFIDGTNTTVTVTDDGPGTRTKVAVNAPASGAPTDATYITQTPNGSLSNEQSLSALATGILKSTTATGIVSIAAAGTDYTSPTGTENLSNKTITTSTLDNSPVGATTPSTGFFTTFKIKVGSFFATIVHAFTADHTVTIPGDADVTLVGADTTQTLTNKTVTQPTLTLKQSTTPTPTAEGDIQWDTDDNRLAIGDGAATQTITPDKLTTNGDLLTFGTAIQSLAAGSQGQGLIVGSGTPKPYWRDILYPPNALINGGFDIWQQVAISPTTTVNYNDDTYFCDQWYILCQTSTIGAAQLTTSNEPNAANAGVLSNQLASAQRFGAAQILEFAASKPFSGRSVRFQARVRVSNSQAVRIALLEWVGGTDAPTSDVVNDWTSSNYTAGNFFSVTNLNVLGVSSVTPAANTYTNISVTGTVGTPSNLIVFIWFEGTATTGVSMRITSAGLYDGVDPVPWIPRSIAEEMILAQRFLKVFYSANGQTTFLFHGQATNTNTESFTYLPPVPFRVTPTLTATAADWQVQNGTNVSAVTAISLNASSTPDAVTITTTATSTTALVRLFSGDSSGDRYLVLDARL